MDKKIGALLIILMAFLTACSTTKSAVNTDVVRKPDCGLPLYVPENDTNIRDVHKWVVYKTKKDYSNLIPIQLAQDKQTILSYPAKEDLVRVGNSNAILLEKGFLLDLIGVNLNSVFTHYSLQQYQLISTPSLEEFKKNIIEIDPFTEMYSCEHKYDQNELNKFILDNVISNKCLKIK
ncbi:MAG: hypothetical protein ACK48V_03235 [Crocinitomicaceae bacterium]|jgi:hypothetical protein